MEIILNEKKIIRFEGIITDNVQFLKNKHYIKKASKIQITQPIYRSQHGRGK